MEWDRIIRVLSTEYGWTPDVVMELTLPQLALYLQPMDDLGSTKKMTPGEAANFRARKKLERELAIQRMM